MHNFFQFNDSDCIGHITEIKYDQAIILSHDFHTSKSNFIPKGSFLIIEVTNKNDTKSTPFVYLLVRVINISYVDNTSKINKEFTVKRLDSFLKNLDEAQNDFNDPINKNELSFYQLETNILGTFYNKNNQILFGSDAYSFNVSNIYRVFKPSEKNLETIVNFIKEDRLRATNELLYNLTNNKNSKIPFFDIGEVRYASTIINLNNEKPAKVTISPADFIKQKTGVFGMTRTGKSNTVKILIDSIMTLSKNISFPIGQIIYDVNGEYANSNEQNEKLASNYCYSTDINTLNSSKNFSPAINNFYINTDYGLSIIQNGIKNTKDSNYLNNFLSIQSISHNCSLSFFWFLLLYKSGYDIPKKNFTLYFNQKTQYLKYIQISLISQTTPELQSFIKSFGKSDFIIIKKNDFFYNLLQNNNLKNFLFSFQQSNDTLFVIDIKNLNDFIDELTSIIINNKNNFLSSLKKYEKTCFREISSILSFILQEDILAPKSQAISGWQIIVPFKFCHYSSSNNDYRETIYNNLLAGQTVILDLSIGDSFTKKYIADELMLYIFEKQIDKFRTEKNSPIINIFIEEAHNIIGKNSDLTSLWNRIAKEGAKYNMGLVYITQEPSGIHESILANTANFVIAHLNNENEINTISKYEDIRDFSESIKRAEDVGFVRLRLLSKPYTIPVQIKKFIN